jgi:molybdopterin converting factor small subunit
MKLRILYSAQLRTAAGLAREDLDLAESISLAELLHSLASERGREVAMHLLTAAGKIQPSLLLAVNGFAVSVHEAAATPLKPGDEVLLMPPIAGG